jgi:2-amino-4-hydroxy-6-hydroxymethyldihydropteridine diphosphokinase
MQFVIPGLPRNPVIFWIPVTMTCAALDSDTVYRPRPEMLEDVYIGFGSNLGDRVAQVREALRRLLSQTRMEAVRVSSLYRTEPVGLEEQGWFVNGAAWLRSRLGPRELMGRLLELEARMGRVRETPGGPRVIDLDLLLYGDAVMDEPGLRIPHPRFHERRFVLVPLCEIAPEVRHPVLGMTIREILEGLEDSKAVECLGPWGEGGL